MQSRLCRGRTTIRFVEALIPAQAKLTDAQGRGREDPARAPEEARRQAARHDDLSDLNDPAKNFRFAPSFGYAVDGFLNKN